MIHRSIVAIMAAAILFGTAGCANMSSDERAAVGLFGGLMAGHPNASRGEAALGAAIHDQARQAGREWGRKYTASCVNCGQTFSFQGQHTQARCPHCGHINTFSYGR